MNFENLKLTALINAYSLFKIPLLAFTAPTIVELSDERSVVRVRLGMRTRNHLGVMYFGALAIGAELSIALKAIQTIQQGDKSIDFIFKDFKAEFLKRADGHVNFICEDGKAIQDLVKTAGADSERHNQTFRGYAIVPSSNSTEPVMRYELTLSVKQRSKKA